MSTLEENPTIVDSTDLRKSDWLTLVNYQFPGKTDKGKSEIKGVRATSTGLEGSAP